MNLNLILQSEILQLFARLQMLPQNPPVDMDIKALYAMLIAPNKLMSFIVASVALLNNPQFDKVIV